MTTITISLPEQMKEFIDQQVSTGGYGTVSEYLRGLIREEHKRQAEARLDELVREGLASPLSEWTKEDLERMKADLRRKYSKARAHES